MAARHPCRPAKDKPFSVTARTISSIVDVIRAGRPVAVRVTHRIQYDETGYTASLLRFRPAGTRRRVRLTWREQDRALFSSLARLCYGSGI